MTSEPIPPAQSRDPSSDDSSADRLRALLRLAGLSQRAAGRLIGVEDRTMRHWCAGEGNPPASVFRALSPRLTHVENLRRMVEQNEKTIEALRDGRVTELGYGPELSTPDSVRKEIDRLRRQSEMHRVLMRYEEAFQRKQAAYFRLIGQWSPHGNGTTEENISEMDAAREEFRAAQAEVDRITEEIRADKR